MTSVTEGQKAPAFKGKDQNGKRFLYPILKAKKWFYIFIRKMIPQPVPYRPVT